MGGPHASRTGLCVYCGKLAKFTCKLCGSLVCEDHYFRATGICTGCLRGKTMSA